MRNISGKERLEWIDLLKGFLLTCICFSHFGNLPSMILFLVSPTGAVYVPVFFLLSGLLFNEKRYPLFKDFVTSKIKSLLIPFVFLFFLFLFLDWNLYLKSRETIIQASYKLFYADGPPKASPLWFVIKLFETNLIYYSIIHFFKKFAWRYIIVFTSSLIGYLLYYYQIHPLLGIDVILSSITFFGIGHLAKESILNCSKKLQREGITKSSLIILFLVIISAISAHYNTDAVLSQNKIHNYFLFYLTSISGALACIFCSALLWGYFQNNRLLNMLIFLKYIALYALPILGTHVYIIIVMNLLLKHFHIDDLYIGFLLKTITIVVLTYFLIVPLLYGKFTFIFKKNKNSIEFIY